MSGNSGLDLTAGHQRYTTKDFHDDLTLSDNNFSGSQSDNVISFGDHAIEPSDDFMSFECMTCGTEMEVPEIFQASGGFNAIVYQLYIFGHFLNETCPGRNDEMEMLRQAQKKYGRPGTYPTDSTTTMSPSKGDAYRTRSGETFHYHGIISGHPVWEDGYGNLVSATKAAKTMPDSDGDEFLKINQGLGNARDYSFGVDRSTSGGIPKDPLDSSEDDSGRDTPDLSAKEKFASKMLNRKL